MNRSVSGSRGVTLLELILVLVIVAVGASLTYPKVLKGVENREAKKALETLRTISQSIRLYELNHGNLLDDSGVPVPIDLQDLENAGYVKSSEYAPRFNYSIAVDVTPPISPPVVTAVHVSSGRTITLTQHATIKGQDGSVTDSAGFLNPNS